MGLLGIFLSPGFWLLGAGLELAYLLGMASTAAFARRWRPGRRGSRRAALSPARCARPRAARASARWAARARILALLDADPMMRSYASNIEQLVWLHLACSASQTISVLVGARGQRGCNSRKTASTAARPGRSRPELRRSTEQQKQVTMRASRAPSSRPARQRIDAEQRIDQQVSLIREQALLAGDKRIGSSLDALTRPSTRPTAGSTASATCWARWTSMKPPRCPSGCCAATRADKPCPKESAMKSIHPQTTVPDASAAAPPAS